MSYLPGSHMRSLPHHYVRLWRYAMLVAFAVFAMIVLDVPVARWVHQQHFSHTTNHVLRVARWPGHYGFTIALVAVCMWRFGWRWGDAVKLLAAGALASIITAIFKLCCGRSRPFNGRTAFDWIPFAYGPISSFSATNLSFPSGDATLAFATAAVFARVMPQWSAQAYAWAILVGVTRVLQGAHYPSDVTVGALIGIMTADAIEVCIREWRRSAYPESLQI